MRSAKGSEERRMKQEQGARTMRRNRQVGSRSGPIFGFIFEKYSSMTLYVYEPYRISKLISTITHHACIQHQPPNVFSLEGEEKHQLQTCDLDADDPAQLNSTQLSSTQLFLNLSQVPFAR